MTFSKAAQRVTAVGSGIIFLIGLLILALAVPHPTPFQYTVFRIVLALAAAAFAATIPGFLDVTVPGIARASGAIAVFLIVYFFSPAELVATGTNSAPNVGPATAVPFEATTEMPGVQAQFVGTVTGGSNQLLVDVTSADLSFPEAAPDGGGRYIPYYRVLLAESQSQVWRPLYQSDRQPVGETLHVGESLSLGPETIVLTTPALNSLAGRWLAFEIGVAISETEEVPGTTYAHTSKTLF